VTVHAADTLPVEVIRDIVITQTVRVTTTRGKTP